MSDQSEEFSARGRGQGRGEERIWRSRGRGGGRTHHRELDDSARATRERFDSEVTDEQRLVHAINFIEYLPIHFPRLPFLRDIRDMVVHDDLVHDDMSPAEKVVHMVNEIYRPPRGGTPIEDIPDIYQKLGPRIQDVVTRIQAEAIEDDYLCEKYTIFFYYFRDVQQHLYNKYTESRRDKDELIDVFNDCLGKDWKDRFPGDDDFPAKKIDQKWLRWRRLYLQFNEEIILEEDGVNIHPRAGEILERLSGFFSMTPADPEPGDTPRFRVLNQMHNDVDINGFIKARPNISVEEIAEDWNTVPGLKEIGEVEQVRDRRRNFNEFSKGRRYPTHSDQVTAIEEYVGELVVDGMTCVAHITNPIKDAIKLRPRDFEGSAASPRAVKLAKMITIVQVWPEMVLTPLILAKYNGGRIIRDEDSSYPLDDHPVFGDLIFSILDTIVDEIDCDEIREKYSSLKEQLSG